MGCGSSLPLSPGSDNENETVQVKKVADDKKGGSPASTPPAQSPPSPPQSVSQQEKDAAAQANKSKTTRARRLSYVTNEQSNTAAQANGNGSKPGTPPAQNLPVGSNTTRARRLSYVTGDPNSFKVPLEGGEDNGEGYEGPAPGEDQIEQGSLEDNDKRPLRIMVACMSRAGREPGFKKTNQDNCFAFEKYITEDQSLFGAMDGHGPHGHLVSGYVKQHLPIILVNHLTTDTDVKKALTSGFVEVDKSLGNSRIDCEFSGSTAVVSYLKGKTITTAWVGDSRGVMGRETKKGWEAIDLTHDHKPTNAEEKARILKSNGRVERLVDEMGQPMGPYRVWLQYAWIPGLAMSRALGDVLAHQVGVTSEPDHTVVELTPQDRFIILASDGVWEFISSKEAVDIAAQYETAEESCRQLVDEAYQRWLTEEEGVVDDITAVVVKFYHQ